MNPLLKLPELPGNCAWLSRVDILLLASTRWIMLVPGAGGRLREIQGAVAVVAGDVGGQDEAAGKRVCRLRDQEVDWCC